MNKRQWYSALMLIIAGYLLIRLVPVAAAADSAQAMFYRANEQMQAGDFARAAAGYEAIVRQGVESGALYYNLGNAYVKQGKWGKALVNYERARRLIPADSDLKANREFVRNALPGQIPETRQNALAAFVRRAFSFGTLEGATFAALLMYWLLAGVLIVRIVTGWRGAGVTAAVIALTSGLLLMSIAGGVKYYDERVLNTAIVTAVQTDGRFGPANDATVYFRLYEGTPVRVIQRTGEWVRIKTPDAKFGWISRDAVEPVSLSPAGR